MRTSNQCMNDDVTAMMKEADRLKTASQGRRNYTDEEVKQAASASHASPLEDVPTTRPLTAKHLYDEMKREQKHSLRVSRRDHIKEINSAMMFSKAPKSMAQSAYSKPLMG